MSHRIDWRGPDVADQVARACIQGLTKFDLKIEARAKAELYPGHGKISGTLQRSIQGEPATRQGNRIRGAVKTKGVRYALKLHKRYQYIRIGFNAERPHFAQYLRQIRGGA
jgi:hypothetical protein